MERSTSSSYLYKLLFIVLIGFLLSMAFSSSATPDSTKEDAPPDIFVEFNDVNDSTNVALPMDSNTPEAPKIRETVIQEASLGDGMKWGEIAKSGISTLVLVAVMIFIVKPLIQQMVESNNTLAKAVGGLKGVIASGNTNVLTKILESERNITQSISELKEDITSIRIALRPD